MFEAFNNAPVVSGAAYLGLLFSISFTVPFSILVLFAEFNVRRNISWYSIIVLVLGGGILSLIVTMILNELSGNPRAAYWAGPIEEAAKLVVAISCPKILSEWANFKWHVVWCRCRRRFRWF